MTHKAERQDMKKREFLVWEKIGRSWVTRVGKLSVVIVERGKVGVDLRWRVADVFGQKHLGSGWHSTLPDATREARALATRELRAAYKSMFAVRGKAKR